ncbi:uncharacterized protein L201_007971 [Kwoniella dendrophila CBS 6074]|uniref:CBM21 domain-containing protein n=1 Tax=Kwoniella dendrophila CBS 6074 TaxID=1295534 RepID=A0AAX4K610_9TREE
MPYAEPTTPSPVTSPVKEYPFHYHRKGHTTPPSHIEDIEYGPSSSTGPMPGIPRRSSSHSGSSTPRRGIFDNVSRAAQSINSHSFPISRPMEGLPRRSPSSSGQSPMGVSGLPPAESSSLGLKLHPSPVKSPLLHRAVRDSITSTSSIDSSLPSTPNDDNVDLPVHIHDDTKNGESSVPFPSFDPDFKPPPRTSASRGLLSPTNRPTLASMRRSSAGHVRGGQHSTGSLQIFPPQTSHSDESSPIIGSDTSMLRPISMIRKKSGEIVKPSLKQRSMSTPDLTRQRQDSPTDEDEDSRGFGEERSKSVRFADTSEGDAKALESVVLFLREQKVTAVGKAADPENSAYTETETENDTDTDFVQFRTRRNAAAKAADENGQIQMEGGSRIPRKRTDFSPDARGSLQGENVMLERIELQSGLGPLSMRGTAIVRNVSFQKWVAVRFTLDHWQTVSEVSGTHVCHIPAATTGDEGWDRFSFAIKLDDYKRKLDERQLMLCVHYSVEGKDWWDSNDGMNYNFTFKKSVPRRITRTPGPAALTANLNNDEDSGRDSPLPGLRKSNNPPVATKISKAFGATPPGPGGWMFPKISQRINGQIPSRPDSPMQTPPPNSFKPPAPPSTYAHLNLTKYCAPSPPQSPPKEATSTIPYITSPDSYDPVDLQRRTSMNVMNGNYATLAAPDMGHERRSSWNGEPSTWDSFAQAMDNQSSTPKTSSGDATPKARRSPEVPAESPQSTPEHKPLTLKRSTGDLSKLRMDAEDSDLGLMTPPSSNLSSPPTPLHAGLPVPMSPSPSASTGESSPVETMSNESTPDLAALSIEIDPDDNNGGNGNNQKLLNDASYQDFLSKFCFFQSPRSTPNELEPVYSRPSYIPTGGASPSGFPFHVAGSNGHNSPRNTSTPRQQYDNAQDAFGFNGPRNPSLAT